MSDTTEDSKELKELFVLAGRGEGGVEGIASYVDPRDGIMKPAVGGPNRLDMLRTVGQALSNSSGIELTLARWTVREDVEVLRPEGE